MLRQLTIRNYLAILSGTAIAFWLVFTRIEHVVDLPVPTSATNSLIVKQNLDVILKSRYLTGYDSPLDQNGDITTINIVSRGFAVKDWELNGNAQIQITYKISMFQKIQMWLGYDLRVLNAN